MQRRNTTTKRFKSSADDDLLSSIHDQLRRHVIKLGQRECDAVSRKSHTELVAATCSLASSRCR